MTLIINSNSVVAVVIFIVLVKINLCNAECNLAKIFRTPRDFDHLEIVERTGFDRTEPSTTPPPPPDTPKCKSTKKNGNNCAKAHVSLRFGTDYGGGHIMKIPHPHPPPTHLLGNSMTHHHNTNFFYPPPQPYRTPAPCPSHQYYHPYPPPVPYVFPNYYFWSPEQEATYLPTQLNEYFMRHPDFVVARYPHNEEVFIGGRPVRRGQVGKAMIPADFDNAKMSPIKIIEDPNVAPNNLPVGLKPVHVIRSRLLSPRYSTQGEGEDKARENNEIKRDRTSRQKDDVIKIENTISMEFSDSFEESPYGKYDQKETDDKNKVNISELSLEDDEAQAIDTISELKISEPNAQDIQNVVGDLDVVNSTTPNSTEVFINDLEQLVIESLVEYNCENSTDPPKMLVGYPITKRDDVLTPDTEQPQLETSSFSDSKQQSKFVNDIDRLKSLKTKDIVDDETYQSCQCSNNSTSSTGKNFTKDVDELVSILIEIIDTGTPSTPKPSYPDDSSLLPGVLSMTTPYVADDSSLYPDVISPFSSFLPKTISPPPPPTPLSTILNLLLGNYALPYTYPSSLNSQIDYVTYLTQYNDYISKIQSSSLSALGPSSDGHDSDPMISREALPPTYVKITPITEEAKLATLGILPNLDSRFNVEDIQDPYVSLMKSSVPRAIVEPKLQTTSLLRQEDSDGLKYISLLSRADIEPALLEGSDVFTAMSYSNTPGDLPPSLQPMSDCCGKCGQKDSKGNHCDNCGYPLMVYPSPMASYCPSCTKEIR